MGSMKIYQKKSIGKISTLFWKTIISKVDFAQDFSLAIISNLEIAKLTFKVPQYVENAFNHLVKT